MRAQSGQIRACYGRCDPVGQTGAVHLLGLSALVDPPRQCGRLDPVGGVKPEEVPVDPPNLSLVKPC
eukprot:1660184-Alexandrium_andersonii.AAC.1